MMRAAVLTICAAAVALSRAATAGDAEVTGTLTGNGQPAKLAFVSSRPGTSLEDKSTVMLIFTEKDHAKDKKPEIGAMFGKHGSALVVTVFPDNGRIVDCEVAHEAHGGQPFSSLGTLETAEFKNEAGQLSGRIATKKPAETFGKKWEVDLTFKAKLP